MKIMIVGGTGLLGYHTALAALADGHEVASFGIDDLDLAGWYPPRIKVSFGDIFKMSEDELIPVFKGYEAFVYSVGPDDRVTPPAPAYEFFRLRLVEHCAKVFCAARRAGVRRAVVFNSYFAYFDRMYPEKKLSEHHPYIRCRVEQASELLSQAGEMEVMILELPYIFGSMPGRAPLWGDVLIERFFRFPAVVFPKGGTTMITAKHVGEAAVGALKYGEPGARYPIGDENHNYRIMLEAMLEGLGMKKPIFQISAGICAAGAALMEKHSAAKGLQSGLNLKRLMLDIMSEELYIPDEINEANSELLRFGRGGVREGILEAVRAAYPDGFRRKG